MGESSKVHEQGTEGISYGKEVGVGFGVGVAVFFCRGGLTIEGVIPEGALRIPSRATHTIAHTNAYDVLRFSFYLLELSDLFISHTGHFLELLCRLTTEPNQGPPK